MRVRALYSPYYLIKVILGYNKLVDHLHLVETEEFVTRWSHGQTKQFVEWPRGFYKTTTFTMGIGIWVVCPVTDEDSEYAVHKLGISEGDWFLRTSLHDQDATQLYAFEVIDNAKKKIKGVRWHFEENELFRSLFPEIAYSGDEPTWNDECLRIRRVGERRRDAEGTFEAIGVGGSLQSRHYKIVWEDDLVGEKARRSDTVMAETIGWHGRLHGAYESAPKQIRFGVSNRWGYADLNSYIRANEPDFFFHTRSAWEIDPETGQERAIFPEEYPMEALLRIRDSGSMTRHDFSCQYLNNPVLPGEREVPLERLHYYSVDKDASGYAVIKCSCGGTYYASALNRYLHYDPYNAKGVGSSSCPALVMAAASHDEHVFILDYFTVRSNYPKIFDRIFHFNDVWRPILFTYEDVGNQNMCEFHINEVKKTVEYKSKHHNFPRIVAKRTGNRAKETRIREALLPVISNKKLALRKTQTEFYEQLDTFPNKRLTDDYDLLDAAAQGADEWRFPEAQDTRDRVKSEEEEYLRHFNEPYGVSA